MEWLASKSSAGSATIRIASLDLVLDASVSKARLREAPSAAKALATLRAPRKSAARVSKVTITKMAAILNLSALRALIARF
jgi:hypothetical protein